MYEFDTSQPVNVSLRIAAGSANIVAEERSTATVEVEGFDSSDVARQAAENTRVDLRGDTLLVEAPEWSGGLFRRGPRVRATIRVPNDGALVVKVASAEVTASGRYAKATVNSASGDISIEHVTGHATAKTASGDVRFDRVDGQLRMDAASGDVSVGEVGQDMGAHCASGKIYVGRIGGSARMTTASGDVSVGSASSGTVKINSASGDISVGVAPGTGVWLDISSMSGTTQSDLDMGNASAEPTNAKLTLQVRTMSGDIDVHRASLQGAA